MWIDLHQTKTRWSSTHFTDIVECILPTKTRLFAIFVCLTVMCLLRSFTQNWNAVERSYWYCMGSFLLTSLPRDGTCQAASAMFDELAQKVGPTIEKQDTNVRKALPSGLKLQAINVRFLPTSWLQVTGTPSLVYNIRLSIGKEHHQLHYP